jgi:hypothetical protein
VENTYLILMPSDQLYSGLQRRRIAPGSSRRVFALVVPWGTIIAVEVTDAAKTEEERSSDNLWIA